MDVPLGGHEDEKITLIDARQFPDGRQHGLLQVGLAAVFVRHRGPPADFDRKRPPGNFNHRRRAVGRGKVGAETGGVDRGRGDDQLQVPPLRQQTLQIPDEKIDIQRPLVGLVQNDRIVLVQVRVALGFGQEDAVGHQFDVGLQREGLGEANFEAHVAAQGRGQLLGDPCRYAAGGNAAGLRVADQAVDPPAQLQTNLRQLRRLARARLAADDDHLVVADGDAYLVASGRDRQIVVVANRRHAAATGLAQGRRPPHRLGQPRQPAIGRPPVLRRLAQCPQLAAKAVAVGAHGTADLIFELVPSGHWAPPLV